MTRGLRAADRVIARLPKPAWAERRDVVIPGVACVALIDICLKASGTL